MSSFRDAFTKEEKKDSLLDYDDSAFLFFAGTCLLCVLVPWTWKLASTTFSPGGQKKKNYKYCQCSFCVNRVESMKREELRWSRRFDWRFFVQFAVISILWGLFAYVASLCIRTPAIQSFNPFEILDLPDDAPERQVKKQYRVMSLKFHPDKNPNDPTAGAKFVMISKAYQALTDEVSRKNYEKYGNPDGPTAMKVGIGLPKFLVEENSQLFFLLLFFTTLLIVLPLIFICYYRNLQRYAQNGVQVETLQFLSYVMSEGTRFKNLPELFAACAESRELALRPSDNADMQALTREVAEPRKRQFNLPIIVRNYFLLLGHIQRKHHLMTPQLKKDLELLLDKSSIIVSSMLEISLMSHWFRTAESVLEFQRSLIHCLGFRNSALLQIPHVDDDVLRQCMKGKVTAKDLRDVLRYRQEDKQLFTKMNQLQLADLGAFCAHVSDLDVEVEIYVDDETDIVVGDVVTVKVKLTRKNLREGECMGPIHAPLFPLSKFEQWWICVTADDRQGPMLGFVRVKSLEKYIEDKVQFPARRPGKRQLYVHCLCDSYSGLDQCILQNYHVYTDKEVRREIVVHPEDEALDDEPTLFQQMIGQLGGEGDTTDEEGGEKSDDDSEMSVSD